MPPTSRHLRRRRSLPVALVLCVLAAAPAGATVATFAPAGDGPAYPDLANGATTPVPALEARRVPDGAIELNGRLDEAVWDEAQTGWGFRQADPNRFAEASVPTVFKVLYDDEAIYFGVACYENDVANISSYLSRRDQIESSDIVSIYIDPYLDRTTGYNFRINPEGVQQDDYIFDNGNRDRDWNAVWEAEVHHDTHGWYVEVRVPFSQFRFRPAEEMTWGLQVYRWLHGRGEDTGWVNWDRDQSGFVSRWGSLTGLRGVTNPRKLEILPYVSASFEDPAAEGDEDGWNNSQNFGADFKYGVTANLTLNATFQPDFGQVEADPALLNLSPFETWYQEKRPFFVEGARYFQHPDFNLFYSRRIGTGDPNSRIRGAAKLTGKTAGGVSIAALAAATDVAAPGRVHNPFVAGDQQAFYGLMRTGIEFDEGNHRVNAMGTAVLRKEETFAATDDERLRRDGYSAGADFELNFDDRMYRLQGSWVGTRVEPDPVDAALPPPAKTGHGGRLSARKLAGDWRGGLTGRWESDDLDPNDMGFISAPDEKIVAGDASWVYNADGDGSAFNNARISLDGYRSWLFAGNTGYDINDNAAAWSYGANHRQSAGIHLEANGQLRSFHQGWIFLGHGFTGTSKYNTRTYDGVRGPLMTTPARNLVGAGVTSDWRKAFSVELVYEYDRTTAGSREQEGMVAVRWNQSEHFTHRLSLGFGFNHEDAQWLDNLANDGRQPGVAGIGGVDYVFAGLDRWTWDVTLRSSILFDRDRSLQVYLQPFLTYGNYADPRYLATPDSYDLRPYALDASDYDFDFGAVNVNVVYRWEYRPGSTIFLVWTHAKNRYEEGLDHNGPGRPSWDNGFDPGYPFRAEPANTFLLKINYWFSI